MSENCCNPNREVVSRNRLDDFSKMWKHLGFQEQNLPLTGDVYEEKDKYLLTLDTPGIKEEDIKIEYNDGELTIRCERKFEKNENSKVHRRERFYGKYARSFAINESIKDDEIKAELKDGVLSIILPKQEEKKAKTIAISR